MVHGKGDRRISARKGTGRCALRPAGLLFCFSGLRSGSTPMSELLSTFCNWPACCLAVFCLARARVASSLYSYVCGAGTRRPAYPSYKVQMTPAQTRNATADPSTPSATADFAQDDRAFFGANIYG